MKKQIRNAILEAKERKEVLLIETEVSKKRLLSVFGDVTTKRKFNSLSENKKIALLFAVGREFSNIEKNIVSENFDLGGIFKSLFGNLFGGSTIETLVEPFVDRILTALGLGGYWKNFLISAFTGNPSEFLRAFSDCKLMTKIIVRSLIEGYVMTLQKEKGYQSFMFDLLRNVLGDTLRETTFATKLEEGLSGMVCGLFEKFSTNASKLTQVLTPSAPGSTPSVPSPVMSLN